MPLKKILTTIAFMLLISGTARAEVSLLGSRIGATDAVSLAGFYKRVFGMHEVNRFVFPDGGIEVMLNFGATEADALANPSAQIVLMPREPDAVISTMPSLIFNVDNIRTTVAMLEEAGGQMQSEEFIVIPAGDDQILIAIAKDPEGNMLELLQQP